MNILSSIQWGDAAEWFSSVFVAAAFAGSMLLFRIEHARDRRSQEERIKLQSAHIKDQAAHISAWYDPSAYQYADGAVPGFEWLCIVNSSDNPIYDCIMRVFIGDMLVAEASLSIVPPINRIQVVKLDDIQFPAKTRAVGVRMTFTDASGRRWSRNEQGHLDITG